MHMEGQGLFYLSSEWWGIVGGGAVWIFLFFPLCSTTWSLGFYVGEYPNVPKRIANGQIKWFLLKVFFKKKYETTPLATKKINNKYPRKQNSNLEIHSIQIALCANSFKWDLISIKSTYLSHQFIVDGSVMQLRAQVLITFFYTIKTLLGIICEMSKIQNLPIVMVVIIQVQHGDAPICKWKLQDGTLGFKVFELPLVQLNIFFFPCMPRY